MTTTVGATLTTRQKIGHTPEGWLTTRKLARDQQFGGTRQPRELRNGNVLAVAALVLLAASAAALRVTRGAIESLTVANLFVAHGLDLLFRCRLAGSRVLAPFRLSWPAQFRGPTRSVLILFVF